MSVFQIPPKTAFIKVSVHIEFIGSSTLSETSRPSTTAQPFDDTVTRHPDQASSEPCPPTEKTPGSNPGGAVFAAGSWVKTIHTIPSTISISSGGRSKPKSKSKSDADADADDESNKSTPSPALNMSYALHQYLSEEPKQVSWCLNANQQ